MVNKSTDMVYDHFSKYPVRKYPKGQILVFADEEPEHIYYISKGTVRKYDVSYRGDEVIVNVYRPRSLFPISWVINKTPNQFFYKTETETDIHIIPVEAVLEFLRSGPDASLAIMSSYYRNLADLEGRMVHLMAGTARSRLLYELIIECQRVGPTDSSGQYVLKLNETDLASRTGLSRETISREIQKLKVKGWIKVAARNIIVHDYSALGKALTGDIK